MTTPKTRTSTKASPKKTPSRKTPTTTTKIATGASVGGASSRAESPAPPLSEFLSRFPARIVALAKSCMTKLRKAFPGANLLVYEYADSLVVSFSMSEHGYEGIVSLKVLPEEVRLYFDKSIPDPKHLLQGSGGKVRSVTIEAASQLDRGDINQLIKEAIRHAGITLPRTGPNRVIVKSAAKAKKSDRKHTKK